MYILSLNIVVNLVRCNLEINISMKINSWWINLKKGEVNCMENELKIKNKRHREKADNTGNKNSASPVKDLTNGSPLKLIIGFAIPMFLGMLFQQFYSLVDTIIVGKYLGVNAFAGVGSTGCINFMVLGFCMGICNGFAIPVAQMFGAKNDVGLRKMVANCIWLWAGFALVITTVVSIFCYDILNAMNTPSDIIEYAYDYILIIFLGIPFMILYNGTAAILRALGDSGSPVMFLALSSILNIGLDLVFILIVKIGVRGAALATVISQCISGIVCTIYMKKKFALLKMKKGEMRPEGSYMVKLIGTGIPMGLQYSITAIGSIILQTAVNGLGSLCVAGVTAGSRINNFIVCPIEALGQTMAPYTGQNIGAGRIERVQKGLKAGILCGFVVSAVMFVVALLFGKPLTMIFLEEKNDQVLDYAYRFLLCLVAFYVFLVFVNCVRFTIQGMGYSGFAIIAGVMEMVARTVAGAVLVPTFGFWGVMLASPLAWIMADLFLVPAFFYCKRRISRILEAEHSKEMPA